MKKILLLFLLLFITSCTANYDEFATYNFTYTASVYNVELNYTDLNSNFAKADAILIESRISDTNVKEAIPYYKEALEESSKEEQAIIYETLASITGNNWYYYKSYKIWEGLNNEFRKDIDWNLFLNKEPEYQFQEYNLSSPYLAVPKDTSHISIGESYFFLTEDDVLVSQVDRVTRDWLSSQLQEPSSENILTVFSEGYDVEDIGWHEGGRISQYKDIINFTHIPATGTIVRKINDKWYAPNEEGTFMFEVPIDKIQYPSTRFLNENLALVIDTHGVNMLVEQAVNNNATVVVACCDHIDKVKAALYLNEKGIKVICNTDKYLPLVLGQTDLTYGSIPFTDAEDKIQFGYQPIMIDVNEKIVVLNATENYGLSYYQTPAIYFSTLKEKTTLPLDIIYVQINDYGQMSSIPSLAEMEGAKVIAARVYDASDYTALKQWLEKDFENRLILFHSEPYPYGYKLLREFQGQVSFDDINPVFLRNL
jgi:hypothetical protein